MELVNVKLRRVAVGLAVLGSALLLMGTSIVSVDPALPSLIWSHDGEHIIFSTPYQGIFVVDAAGRRLMSIPENAPLGSRRSPGNYAPALSPDGRQVAYVTYSNNSDTITAIETAALDGTGIQRLTVYKDRDGDGIDDNRNVQFPVWSLDGSRIAFLSGSQWGGAPTYLSIMDTDGTNEGVLVPSVKAVLGSSGPPQTWWSPDHDWLAFVGEESYVDGVYIRYRHDLYTLRSDGSTLTGIGEIQQLGVASWSPDSSRLAFVVPHSSDLNEYHHILYTVRPDGSAQTEVSRNIRDRSWGDLVQLIQTFGFGFRNPPAWSPDGAWLAFAKEDEEGLGIYVARPDGTDLRLVVRGYGGPVSWSSDGTELYIADMAHAIRPDGTGLRSLLTEEILWPGGLNFTAWSPDGLRLAVLTVSRDHSFTLFTLARDGTDKRVLVKGTTVRVVAQHSGWYDVPRHMAACAKGFVVPEPEANFGLVQDCETLLAARDILIGDGYVNWSAADLITAWEGVEVGCPVESRVFIVDAWAGVEARCTSSLRVIGLHLTDLAGQIPASLSKLSALRSLKLSYYEQSVQFHKFRPLPPELENLANLEELHIEATGQFGSIPPQWGNLANLKVLRLRGAFPDDRSIPPELGKLVNLRELYLGETNLSGNIPPELGNLINLRVLFLYGNSLTGAIPPELGKLASLESLVLYQNSLSGPIPPKLGKLISLTVLLLQQNSLTGHIPPELGDLASLAWLDLGDNELTGAIPPELKDITNLSLLNLAGNNLTGCVPRELRSLKDDEGDGWEFCK